MEISIRKLPLAPSGYRNDNHGGIGAAGTAWSDTWSFSGPQGVGLTGVGFATVQYSVFGSMTGTGADPDLASASLGLLPPESITRGHRRQRGPKPW